MDPIVSILLKQGVVGLLAGLGFYLFIRQLKLTEKLQEQNLDHLVADTAAKTKLTTTLEDLAETVKLLGDRNESGMTGCQTNVNDAMEHIQGFIDEQRRERAKDEGRREATNPRFRIPKGDSDDT